MDCYQTSKVNGPDNMPCVSSNIELREWDHGNETDSGSRADGSSSQVFSGQHLNHSSRFLSRFSFVPGSVSFRLSRAASVGSSRDYPSSPMNFSVSSGEGDHLPGISHHLISSHENQTNSSLNSSRLTSASVGSHGNSSVNLVQLHASSTLSGSLQDNQVLSAQNLVNNPDVSLRSHIYFEVLNRTTVYHLNCALKQAYINVLFSITFSVVKLLYRFLLRPSFSDITLSPLHQDIVAAP